MPSSSASSGSAIPAIATVVGGVSPAPPVFGPDMSLVWSAAVAQDPTPGLATFGKTATSGGRIALTFDDGPDPLVTPQVLDTLQEYDVKATFFVVGRYVEQHPEVLQRMVAEGHILGNHTYSHADMSTLGAPQLRRELQKTQRAVNRALGYKYPMSVMRPPYGHPYLDGASNLPVFQEVVRERGLFPVLWTPSPQDYLFEGRPEKIVRHVQRQRAPGHRYDGVLLLHDTKQQTADALPGVIEHYISEGLEFADVHELLADKYLDE
jgi:peptidoglycan/xylan/chitin deacetylase (PgdA/CDA1 family)